MRATFIRTLVDIAARDPRVVLLTGDLGFMVVEPFADRFPDRFFNVGVAEQNMVGIATGLAEAGYIPFCYSIVTFATLRPYEFIRNGPLLHHLPVRIVGVGGGFEYGSAGPTHHGLEDVGVLRVHPGMTLVAPADFQQAAAALRATWDHPGPIYFRLGKDDRTRHQGLAEEFVLGAVSVLREGSDLTLLSMGNATALALEAAAVLAREGIEARVVAVPTMNPAPTDALLQVVKDVPLAVTVEAHYVWGGLGSLVAEVVAENDVSCRLVRCGVRSRPTGISGSEQFLLAAHGLTPQQIASDTRVALKWEQELGEPGR